MTHRLKMSGAVAACLSLLLALGPAHARDVASMKPDEIKVLEQRLADAGCYKGAIDGAASPALDDAANACPDQDPWLRIETGTHAAPIRSLGVDAACTIAATGSDDKTVRLWSMPDGRPLRTQRLPIGVGDAGKVFAVAVSPDGRLVAAGGYDAAYSIDNKHAVYLFDAATGQDLRLLGSLEWTINAIAFSPDGKRIAVGSAGGGVHLLDVASGEEIASDKDFHGDSKGLAFGPDGALYATGFDGFIRGYGPDGRRTRKIATKGGKRPFGIAVDPKGSRIAVGFDDGHAVELFDARTLARLGQADTGDLKDGLSSVAWSTDGQQLVAGGFAAISVDNRDRMVLRRFDTAGHRLGDDVPVAGDQVMQMARCGKDIAFASFDLEFGLLHADGTTTTLAHGAAIDMRDKTGDAFTVSPDGMRVRLGLAGGAKNPILVDLADGRITDAANPVDGLKPANLDGLKIDDWQDSGAPKFKGRPLKLDDQDLSRALAIRSDGTGFVLGTALSLRAFDAEGTELWTKEPPSEATGVNLAKDDDLVVAAYRDGTIRWHRFSDGAELLALFVDKDDRRFVAWTPTGYYMASPGAENLIGWQVNRGWSDPADFFPAAQFRDQFNRPDIVRLVLQTLDEDAAVKQADEAAHRRKTQRSIITKLPPVLRILSPAPGADFGEGNVSIDYAIRSPSGLAVDRIDVLIDGVRQQDRGFNRLDQPGSGESKGTLSVHLPEHDVEVALVVHSGDLASEPTKLRLVHAGASRGADLLKPKLYALIAGVSDYADPGLKLGFASKDARDFGAALQAQSGGLYSGVEVKVIVDKEATRLNLIRGLKWLETQVTSRDVGIVFLAGHGVTDAQQAYWFLPVDAIPEELDASALSQDEIKRTLNGLAGKALLFLDSCHAGQIVANGTKQRGTMDINKVVGDFAAADNGVVAFASSTGREVSQERDTWGNGAFTKALVEGLVQGKADLLGNGTITLSELDAFVVNRVKELTGGQQHPVMTRPTTVPDYPIAVFRR